MPSNLSRLAQEGQFDLLLSMQGYMKLLLRSMETCLPMYLCAT